MIKKFTLATCVASIALLLTCVVSKADVIVQPTLINNTMGSFSSDWLDSFTVDQSGLNINYTSNVTDFDAYIASNPQHLTTTVGTYWFSSNAQNGVMDFDLGEILAITRVALWNPGNSNSTMGFNVYTSNDAGFGSSTFVGSYNLGIANLPQVFDLDDSIGRYVRLEMLSNHGGSFHGFGEIAFATANIPEPTVLLPLAGLAIGLIGRRKRC